MPLLAPETALDLRPGTARSAPPPLVWPQAREGTRAGARPTCVLRIPALYVAAVVEPGGARAGAASQALDIIEGDALVECSASQVLTTP